MVRVFREEIDAAKRKIIAADDLYNEVAADNEVPAFAFLPVEERDLLLEGLNLVVAQEEGRVERLAAVVAECELSIQTNLVLRRLSEAQAYLPEGYPALSVTLTGAIEVIGKLAGKAGMRG
jgi:hypothetical protein